MHLGKRISCHDVQHELRATPPNKHVLYRCTRSIGQLSRIVHQWYLRASNTTHAHAHHSRHNVQGTRAFFKCIRSARSEKSCSTHDDRLQESSFTSRKKSGGRCERKGCDLHVMARLLRSYPTWAYSKSGGEVNGLSCHDKRQGMTRTSHVTRNLIRWYINTHLIACHSMRF